MQTTATGRGRETAWCFDRSTVGIVTNLRRRPTAFEYRHKGTSEDFSLCLPPASDGLAMPAPMRAWPLLVALLTSGAAEDSSSAEDGSCSSTFECAPHVVVPSGVTRIPKFAFKDCVQLESIELPDSLEYIGSSAFSGTRSLTSVTLPNGLQHIGTYAFSRSGLLSVTLPPALTSLEEYAFNECTNLAVASMAQAQLQATATGVFLSLIHI